jgi:Phosphoinositide phospholipase C, Ca2+-dependent
MVRTRADLPVDTGLSGDPTRLADALASGAQWVSGDYLTPTDSARYDAAFALRYHLPFDPGRPPYQTVVPGGAPARCNPLTAPATCRSSDVEHLVEPAVEPVAELAPRPVVTPSLLAPRFTG